MDNKIVISMKNPDCVSYEVRGTAENFVNEKKPTLIGEAREEAIKAREKYIQRKLAKWVEYEEYINIEFDLDKGTATVLKSDKCF